MTTQELVERLRRTADLPDTSRIDPLLAKVMTAIAELMAASADRLSEMHEALRLIANATHPRFRAEDDIDLLYANEEAFGKCIDIARAALTQETP